MDDPTLLSWIERGQNIAALLVALGVAAEFVLGFMAGPARRRVDQAKDAEMVRLVDSSKDLEKGVADAKAEMSKQQARAATAERDLLDLKERIKPRRLTDQQCIAFVGALKTLPSGAINFGYTSASGDEGLTFLNQLLPLFKEAGWEIPEKITGVNNHLEIQVIGVGVLIPDPHNTDHAVVPPPGVLRLNPVETALRDAFKAVGIDVQFINWYSTPSERPELVIGSKPNPAK